MSEMSAAAFSCDGSAVIGRQISVEKQEHQQQEGSDINNICEVDRCATWIHNGSYTKVALQFPDELLCYSTAVVKRLLELCSETQICVLADTSYGSCCVDEVAAQHYNADAIIHFGHACLSPTRRLPVLYIFGQNAIEPKHCVESMTRLLPDPETKLLVFYDVSYYHAFDALSSSLRKYYNQLLVSTLKIPEGKVKTEDADITQENPSSTKRTAGTEDSHDKCFCEFGRKWYIPYESAIDDYNMLYIGQECHTLTNLMMSFSRCKFHTYNPLTQHCRTETISVNKMLMKRYYLIERAKDAQIVGIVVGTLGVSDYLLAIKRLKNMIKLAGKKSYTFVMGKLNVAKLANFMEVDIYVLVACPENSLLDSSEFYRPVVTPFELETALNPDREWTDKFMCDFRQLLPGAASYVALPESIQEAKADVSLVTGGIRSLGLEKENDDERECSDILSRDRILTMAERQDAGHFLSNRQWQGLEQKMGETPVTKAVEGTSGIAMAYTHEPQN